MVLLRGCWLSPGHQHSDVTQDAAMRKRVWVLVSRFRPELPCAAPRACPTFHEHIPPASHQLNRDSSNLAPATFSALPPSRAASCTLGTPLRPRMWSTQRRPSHTTQRSTCSRLRSGGVGQASELKLRCLDYKGHGVRRKPNGQVHNWGDSALHPLT